MSFSGRWAPFLLVFSGFCSDFQRFCEGFQRFCPDFQGFCPDFHQIKILEVRWRLASYTVVRTILTAVLEI